MRGSRRTNKARRGRCWSEVLVRKAVRHKRPFSVVAKKIINDRNCTVGWTKRISGGRERERERREAEGVTMTCFTECKRRPPTPLSHFVATRPLTRKYATRAFIWRRAYDILREYLKRPAVKSTVLRLCTNRVSFNNLQMMDER